MTGSAGTGPSRPRGAARFARRASSIARRRVLGLVDGLIAVCAAIFSRAGAIGLAVVLLVGAALSGWIETPLQGVIRGYAYPLAGHVAVASALRNPPRLLSFAVPCLLAAAILLWRRARGRGFRLEGHVGAAVLLVALAFAALVVCRSYAFVDALVAQNEDRAAMRAFAGAVGGFTTTLPARELAGTATLGDRALTVLRLVGYGWWFAVLAAGALLATGLPRARRPALLVTGWAMVTVLVVAVLAAPAIVAELHRWSAEQHYARGRYAEALDRLQAAVAHQRELAQNPSFRYREGAILYWLGDRSSPDARLFIATNLWGQRELDRAEQQLTLALAAAPDSPLLRRKLAELHTVLGIGEFTPTADAALVFRARGGRAAARAQLGRDVAAPAGKYARWERARAIDPGLLRARYYLARAYYQVDGVDQSRAIDEAQELVALTGDRVVLSDLYAFLGDCYFKARRDDRAREMYFRAQALVPLVKNVNLAAQRGLLGL